MAFMSDRIMCSRAAQMRGENEAFFCGFRGENR